MSTVATVAPGYSNLVAKHMTPQKGERACAQMSYASSTIDDDCHF